MTFYNYIVSRLIFTNSVQKLDNLELKDLDKLYFKQHCLKTI